MWVSRYMDRQLRKRHGTDTDERTTPVREIDHADPATGRTVQKNKETLMEICMEELRASGGIKKAPVFAVGK